MGAGVDFLADKRKNYYFLESNADSGLSASAMGMPEQSTDKEMQLEMIKRVVA